MDDVYALACSLRSQYATPDERVTFTHVPVTLGALAVLSKLRSSRLAPFVAPEGTALTHPEHPWYGPVELIHASEAALVAAKLTASTWEPPMWDFRAAELAISLVYEGTNARAQQRLVLHATEHATTLTRVFYDEQRAETGYEGDDRATADITKAQVIDFLLVVRESTESL
jgi:hypothetical protein